MSVVSFNTSFPYCDESTIYVENNAIADMITDTKMTTHQILSLSMETLTHDYLYQELDWDPEQIITLMNGLLFHSEYTDDKLLKNEINEQIDYWELCKYPFAIPKKQENLIDENTASESYPSIIPPQTIPEDVKQYNDNLTSQTKLPIIHLSLPPTHTTPPTHSTQPTQIAQSFLDDLLDDLLDCESQTAHSTIRT